MKPKLEDPLLAAVFADGWAGDYSDEVLTQTLRAVRGRRRRASAVRGGMLAAAVFTACLIMSVVAPRTSNEPRLDGTGPTVVRTQSLRPSLVITSSAASLAIIESRSDTVTKIASAAPDGALEWLDDATLFAVAAGRPIGIVWPEDATARVVWADVEGATWR